jgi:putative membrane protein
MFLHTQLPMGPLGILFVVLGGLAWLAVVAGVVLLVIWAIRALPGTSMMRAAPVASPVSSESPLDILARRFAQGEITAEDYERARDLLRDTGSKP